MADAGAPGPIERAVCFDSTLTALIGAAERGLAGFLTGRGYARLDDRGLEAFLTQRIEDPRPSVVVFAMEHPPATVAGDSLKRSLLRRAAARVPPTPAAAGDSPDGGATPGAWTPPW